MPLPAIPSTSKLQTDVAKAVGFREALDRQIDQNSQEIGGLEAEEHLLTLVSQLIRSLADAEVTDGVESVAKLQTEGLQEIFADKDLSLEAEVTEKRGKVSVDLLTVDKKPDGSLVRDTWELFGGSVSAIQSVLLRVIVIFRRGMRPLLLLDESLAAVARNYVDRTASFLATLADRLGMDILVVSHDPLLIDGAQHAYVVEMGKDSSITFKEKGR